MPPNEPWLSEPLARLKMCTLISNLLLPWDFKSRIICGPAESIIDSSRGSKSGKRAHRLILEWPGASPIISVRTSHSYGNKQVSQHEFSATRKDLNSGRNIRLRKTETSARHVHIWIKSDNNCLCQNWPSFMQWISNIHCHPNRSLSSTQQCFAVVQFEFLRRRHWLYLASSQAFAEIFHSFFVLRVWQRLHLPRILSNVFFQVETNGSR